MKVKEFKKCKNCGKEFKLFSTTDKFCKKGCMLEFEKEKRKEKKEAKKLTIPALIRVLDVVFSRYIRLRDCIETTGTKHLMKCFTCDSLLDFVKSQNMHFVGRAVKSLRYDEENCHGGCMRCNVILHGNYLEYFIRMEKKYGRDKVDEMLSKKHEIGKFTSEELQEKITYYKEQIKILENKYEG